MSNNNSTHNENLLLGIEALGRSATYLMLGSIATTLVTISGFHPYPLKNWYTFFAVALLMAMGIISGLVGVFKYLYQSLNYFTLFYPKRFPTLKKFLRVGFLGSYTSIALSFILISLSIYYDGLGNSELSSSFMAYATLFWGGGLTIALLGIYGVIKILGVLENYTSSGFLKTVKILLVIGNFLPFVGIISWVSLHVATERLLEELGG
ncbi:MAG: hypothetical protein DRO10_03905 [Thermoprotei archaeon]|nr:MAG: hypothetical protein DRO10_03905 [Thermoprotei archaeon]